VHPSNPAHAVQQHPATHGFQHLNPNFPSPQLSHAPHAHQLAHHPNHISHNSALLDQSHIGLRPQPLQVHGSHHFASSAPINFPHPHHSGHQFQSVKLSPVTSSHINHVQVAQPLPFSVHVQAPRTHQNGHVSLLHHIVEPLHPLGVNNFQGHLNLQTSEPGHSAALNTKPFVSFGPSSKSISEPSIVNTVQLRKSPKIVAGKEKVEPTFVLAATTPETRQPKAIDSENQFKATLNSMLFTTPTVENVQVNVTPNPIISTVASQRTISQSNTAERESFVSFGQQSKTDINTSSVTENPTTEQTISRQPEISSTNVQSSPSPTFFSTLTSQLSKPRSNNDKVFDSLVQNKPSSGSSVTSIQSPTTRQPRILQAVTPLVNIFATSPSATILPNPTINLGSTASNAQVVPTTSTTTFQNPVQSRPTGTISKQIQNFAQPSILSPIRSKALVNGNTFLSIPVESKSQKTTQCQHPVGGGSYTCISFGAPHKPIFAFHTVQGEDGFFFGTGSGFPEHTIINGPSTVRRRRKVKKELIEKELARIKKEKNQRKKHLEEINETNVLKLSMSNEKLPLTSYQKKVLSQSRAETTFQKFNTNKGRNWEKANASLILDTISQREDASANLNMFQTGFVTDIVFDSEGAKKSLVKTVTTPKIQRYEYPVEETISYLTLPSQTAIVLTTPSSFSEPKLQSSKTTNFSTSVTVKPGRSYPSSYNTLKRDLIVTKNAELSRP